MCGAQPPRPLTIACKRRPIASARTSLRLLGAPEAWRWVAGRSLAVWRGPEKKQSRHDRPRPHGACPLSQSRHTNRSQAQASGKAPCCVGRSWSPQAPGAAWLGACTGSRGCHVPTGGWQRVIGTGSQGAAESAVSCAIGLSARPVLWRGVRRWPAATVGAADRAGSPQPHARTGKRCGVGGPC